MGQPKKDKTGLKTLEAELDPAKVFTGRQADLELQAITRLFHQRIPLNLKQVSLKGWSAQGLARTSRELQNIVAGEGVERVIHELRQAPALAALEGGMIAIEVVPNAAPTQTYVYWQQGMSLEFEQRMYSVASADPARFVEAVLPVGTTFDLRDAAYQQELAASPVYTSIYDTLYDSWVSVALERTEFATWYLTCWHQIREDHHRLFIRTALGRLAQPLRTAFRRLGLFGPPNECLPVRRGSFIKGANLKPTDSDFGQSNDYAKIELNSESNLLTEEHFPSSSAERSIEELNAERKRLRALLDPLESQLLAQLGFARAVPVRTFNARASRLVDGFDQDPRPLVIYVSGTDRSCILKPADPDDLPEEVISVGKLGQHGSPQVKRVSESRGPGAIRLGLRRGGKRTGRIVAELCPPNDDSELFLAVLGLRRET